MKLRKIVYHVVILLTVNLIALSHLLPVCLQLLINATCCVYIGCILSIKIEKNKPNRKIVPDNDYDNKEDNDNIIGTTGVGIVEAVRFPIVASVCLSALYLLYKYCDKMIVNIIINLIFSLTTIVSTSASLLTLIDLPDRLNTTILELKPYRIFKSLFGLQTFILTFGRILTTLLCSLPIIIFYLTNNWLLNNSYAILFSITAIKTLNFTTIKISIFLMWLLFLYDIFWVYGTDVMLTVAQNITIPVKLMFPYLHTDPLYGTIEKFSILGLGDIVIPGAFISICLKYDVDTYLDQNCPHKLSEIPLTYFYVGFVAYLIGLVQTFFAMMIF